MDLRAQRREYRRAKLRRQDLNADPVEQFNQWFQEAKQDNVIEPNAMILSTVSSDGHPSARTVLLKGVDDGDFVFYTNYESRKAREMEANPNVSLLFPWLIVERQVKVQGSISKVSAEDSLQYFQTRPRGSRLGAWASEQSSVIQSREVLELSLDKYKREFADKDIPMPDNWGGYRVKIRSIEFWQGGENRLHDRFLYTRDEGGWKVERLAP